LRLGRDGIRSAATAAGAMRLSVQTEVDNVGALRLYEAIGFTPVDGYLGLAMSLAPEEGG
jgi:ribosomal protein S18 acetylase RimI-like enzyme